MNTTKEQQKELDDALVAPKNYLKIGKSNLRLSSNLISKEHTLQVVLDALKLTPFYNAFEISADVPEIYMQELWVTVTRHHSSLRFKLDGKSHTVNVDNFRDMLKICPKLPGQKFEEPPLEEDRSFAAIINKCLSGKTTALESLHLSRAQILWGMYHNKQVHYVYLLWEDLDTQEYGAILPQHLTNQAMLESEAFKTYRAYATGEKAPKSKATKKNTDSRSSPKTKPSQASKGKRIKTSAKGDKPTTTKSKGDGDDILLKVLDEQQQTGSGINEGAGDKPEVPDVPEYRSESEEESWTFSQGAYDEEDEEHDSDDDNDDNNDEDDDQENDSQRTELDDEGDDFVHPNLSTYIADDQEKEKEEENADDDDDDVTSGQKVSTPPDYELTEEDENK
ncbi:hypothetical protein Tco_0953572 [Tanacetum coccineum]|uniref:Uncharacterized protein n=1 Tax=Tanacetum coccineum TaxID=301880 RepID=A0ABQ5E104_9ASTR